MITPLEIRQKTFNKRFRGYAPEEVDAFLQEISKEWESQGEDLRKLREELQSLKNSYNTLKEVEDMLHKTLQQAEESSRETLANARRQGELKIQEAEVQAREILRQGQEERNKLEREVMQLAHRRDEIFIQLRILLRAQLDSLHSFERRNLKSNSMAALGEHEQATDIFNLDGDKATGDRLLEDISDEL